MPTPDLFVQHLQRTMHGQVICDPAALVPYSRDQSIFKATPRAVVIAADMEDVLNLVTLARTEGVSITPRGNGSGTAGAAVGSGIVLTFAKDGPFGQIREWGNDGNTPLVRVGPGAVHNSVQKFLLKRGFFLPADPSSGAISVIGGNIATKASGPHELGHGSIDRFLTQVQVVTSTGAILDTAHPQSIPPAIAAELATVRVVIENDPTSFECVNRKAATKCASGYNLGALWRGETQAQQISALICGSVGTLGIITSAVLKSCEHSAQQASTLLYFCTLSEAASAVGQIRALGVAALEIVNATTLEIVRTKNPDLDLPREPAHLLLVEYEGDSCLEQIAAVEQLLVRNRYRLAAPAKTVTGAQEQQRLWAVRKALLPSIRKYRDGFEAFSLVNDIGVDPHNLARAIEKIEAIFACHGLDACIYGHAGSGNLHLRPFFDRSHPALARSMQQVADDIYEAVIGMGGTITAEHGMGRLRAPWLEREWGPFLTAQMRKIKHAFDPDALFNPGVMFAESDLVSSPFLSL